MPKELVHWWLAVTARTRLPLDRPTRHLLEEQQTAYLIGAVLPDTLLHLVRGPHRHTANQLSDAFHESRNHSYAPLLAFVARTSDLSPSQQACLLGIATHIETDTVFHPFVYALAGNDLGQHYRVETRLDLWLLHHKRLSHLWELQQLLEDESARTAAVQVLAGVFDPLGQLPREALDEALRRHGRIQARYGSGGWQLLARLLGLLPGTPFHRWQHLFYPYRSWQRGRPVQWPSRWQHPTTGNERGDTPEGLLVETITRITTLLRNVDEVGLLTALRKQPGENLLTGLPPA